METEESPVIILPEDKTHKKQLRDKLAEYKKRIRPYHAHRLQIGTICKIEVLKRLLRDGRVNTWELSQEMFKTYESSFDVNAFNNVCGVIEDYCKTSGQSVLGGTGLRKARRKN